ncbi:hypothetical protein BV25DRAFT_1139076 [Artomyces pyxidatus]|uniref:Uncharacterized protein n=1 Tax=Artomyces pyxidatus TaxID=48021 RepID=A0ACB8SU25_9AGAM|nr:hypothetical protein BV25DRAFT_1139076 [Artomyces pyxidatus]
MRLEGAINETNNALANSPMEIARLSGRVKELQDRIDALRREIQAADNGDKRKPGVDRGIQTNSESSQTRHPQAIIHVPPSSPNVPDNYIENSGSESLTPAKKRSLSLRARLGDDFLSNTVKEERDSDLRIASQRPVKRLKVEVVIERPSRRLSSHRPKDSKRKSVKPVLEFEHDVQPGNRGDALNSSGVLQDALDEEKASTHPRTFIKEEMIEEVILHKSDKLPDVKIKGGIELDAVTVQSRFTAAGAVPVTVQLETRIRNVTVTREFMAKTFGGSARQTFPAISAKHVRAHGYKHFMFMNLNWNPCAPQLPGAPGLWFSQQPAEGEMPVHRVFVRRDNNSWLYVGQYTITPAPSLTQTEWLCQSNVVRNTWATEIWWREWGRFVRASIVLRRDKHREPTRAEIDRACAIETKDYRNLAIPDIMSAFDKGEQLLGVWTMQCVEYDEQFQRRLAEEFPEFTPSAKPVTEKQTPLSAKAQGKRKRTVEDRGVRREVVDLLKMDDEFAEFVPRGTRSRPRPS